MRPVYRLTDTRDQHQITYVLGRTTTTTTTLPNVVGGREKETNKSMDMFVRDHVGERAADLGHLDERPVVVLHGVLGDGLPELLVAVLRVLRHHAHRGADGDGVAEADGALAGAEVVGGVQVVGLAEVQRPPRLGRRGRLDLLLGEPPRRLHALLERVHLHL
uniref:Uncharacterized protein n=1 Tax=Zea mays TaxID=4577 RepID=A0A804N1J8_MAIZE